MSASNEPGGLPDHVLGDEVQGAGLIVGSPPAPVAVAPCSRTEPCLALGVSLHGLQAKASPVCSASQRSKGLRPVGLHQLQPLGGERLPDDRIVLAQPAQVAQTVLDDL